jgi:hypothetical protein
MKIWSNIVTAATNNRELGNSNRSRVQGSTFRVKDKGKIEDPKSSQKLLVLQHNRQCAANFQMGMTKPGASHINTPPKWSKGTRMQP